MIDIQAGDVVVCVNAAPIKFPETPETSRHLRVGALYRVGAVLFSRSPHSDAGTVGLQLVGVPNPPRRDGYRADRFRKVTKADEGFCQHMKMLKPAKTRETA